MNDGPSHYGRDFRDNNDLHQPPLPPRAEDKPNEPFRKGANPDRNFRGPPPRGPAPPRPPAPDRDRMIKREPSWASDSGPQPRNFGRSRSFTNDDMKDGPHGPNNRPGPPDGPPLRHRDTSFGGPPPPKFNRDVSGTREPPFREPIARDRDGHGFRDGHHPKKGPPPLHLGPEGNGRDRDHTFVDDISNPGLAEERNRPLGDRERPPRDLPPPSSSFGRPPHRESSFGSNLGPPPPRGMGGRGAGGGPGNSMDKSNNSAGNNSGGSLNTFQGIGGGRPTDPRRRGSLPVGGTPNDRFPPPGGVSRMSSYSSLADSTAESTFGRSSGAVGIRRAQSDSAFRNDRDRPDFHTSSSPKWPSERPGSFGNSSNAGRGMRDMPPISLRNRDPRFNRTDSSTSSIDGQHHRQESSDSVEVTGRSGDQFGRSREWDKMPWGSSGGRGPSHPDSARSSPMKSKPVKAFLDNSLPSSSDKTSTTPAVGSTTATKSINTSGSVTSKNTASDYSAEPPKKPKLEKPPPLLITSLGGEEAVKHAETVMSYLHEVAPAASAERGAKELPSKREILAAVEEINKLVKKTEEESEDAEKECKKAKEEEVAKKAREATIHEEKESKRKEDIEKRKEERRKEEDLSKILAEQEAEDQSKIRYEEELKKRGSALDEQVIKAKEEKKVSCDQALDDKLKELSAAMDKSVSRARRDMEKSKTIAKEVGKKLAKADKAHKTMLENEKKKKQKKKKPLKKESIPLEDIINSITMENKRKIKEAHALSLSIADPHFGMSNDYVDESQQKDSVREQKDPKYEKTFEEWSIMSNQVAGISDCLYSEPSDTPYYDIHEKSYQLVGPSVKEFVRDKQKRLNKHWLMLAEEYEVRKRLYEKQQRKLAKKAQRVSVTSRKSILGKKEEDKTDDKGKNAETGGRATNNPYRRSRRDGVRSEYEQEQIIAEIAAKEAMEKRITHGGSKIPRQECPLERVSSSMRTEIFMKI